MKLSAADHVLDVGCGSGGPALFLAREIGCHVTGIDIGERASARAKNWPGNSEWPRESYFDTADVSQPLPFPDDQFEPWSPWTPCATYDSGPGSSPNGAAFCVPAVACSSPILSS